MASSGLQAERTDLAWTRTGLAFFTNGALLLLRPELIAPTPLHRTVAGLSFALALFAVLMARHRHRQLARRPLPASLAAPWPLGLLSLGVLACGVGVLAVVVAG